MRGRSAVMGWKLQWIVQKGELDEYAEAKWLENVHLVPGRCSPMVKTGLWVQFPVKGMYLVCRFTPHPSRCIREAYNPCVSLALMLSSEKAMGVGEGIIWWGTTKMFMGIDKKMLGSLLAKFYLPVLTFPPLKMKKWLNDFLQLWSQQELWIPTASQDGSSFLESHLFLAIGFTFYCLQLNWRIIAAILKHLGIIFMISNSSVILLLKILQLIRVVLFYHSTIYDCL